MLLKGKAISSLISVAFSVLMLNGCSLPNSLPDTSPEGMVAIKSTKNTIVYKHEYVDFSQYSQVTLENSKASIDDNWKKSYNKEKRISSRKLADEDIEKATKQLAELMDEVFYEEFKSANGFVKNGPIGKGTLLIRPTIIDLKLNAIDPDNSVRTHAYTYSRGELTLFLEIFDANSNKLLARVIDRKVDSGMGPGFSQRTSKNANRAYLTREVREWAIALRSQYDEMVN